MPRVLGRDKVRVYFLIFGISKYLFHLKNIKSFLILENISKLPKT